MGKSFYFKKNIIVIVIAALLALGVGGTAAALGVSNAPANRVSRYMGAAERYLSEMNYEQAIIEFQRILEINPMNVDAYLGLADAYLGLDNTEKAIEILREGLEQTGDDRIKSKLDELTENPEMSSSISSVFSSEPIIIEPTESVYGSMGSVTILGEEYDIATTERLLIYNKTNYEVGHFISELLDDPEVYNTKYPHMAHSVICLNGELSETEFHGVISEVKKLINLRELEIDFLEITDISALAELTNLTSLSFNFNSISNISALERLTNLNHLWLNGNEITDISPIAGLTNLKSLSLWEAVKDISPITGLTNLTSLELGAAADLTPLAGLKNLKHLTLAGGDTTVDLVPLTGLKDLTNLRLWRPVSDSDLKLLKESLSNCEIEIREE